MKCSYYLKGKSQLCSNKLNTTQQQQQQQMFGHNLKTNQHYYYWPEEHSNNKERKKESKLKLDQTSFLYKLIGKSYLPTAIANNTLHYFFISSIQQIM